MKKSQMLEFVQNEFLPLELSLASEALSQVYDAALRYFNIHSGLKNMKMFDVTESTVKVTLDTSFSTVAQVYPSAIQSDIIQRHPWQILLNMTLIDNMTNDLVMLSHAYQEYLVYMGKDFSFTFIDATDSDVAPYLLVENVPQGTTKLCVVGTKRIVANEDVKQEFALDWLLRYMVALTKIKEGMILRKADIIDVKNDGNNLISEGKEEKKELEDILAAESRYLAFGRRI
jgi:hypothetical protein